VELAVFGNAIRSETMSNPNRTTNSSEDEPVRSGGSGGGADRRTFLKTAASAGAGVVATSSATRGAESDVAIAATPIPRNEPPVDPGKMPMTRIGDRAISRLIVGANPMWGFSHRGELLSKLMMEYYTTPQVVKVLQHCEACGVNTWQTSLNSRHKDQSGPNQRVFEAWRMLKESGSRMNVIVLVTPRDLDNATVWDELLKMKPVALVHHGNVTDRAWVEGNMTQVRERLKRFRDTGALVGCSLHTPEALAWIEDEGWDLDLYMASFYRASRKLRDHWNAVLEHEPLHEMYLEGIPDLMCPVIRQVKKPVLAYKILAAGRLADRTAEIERAFEYAFQNIKPNDGVIVGMFPKFRDQVTESARLTTQYGSR
jgi:hypothetical protein